MIEEVHPDLLLQDFGVSVTAGAISGLGILDRHSDIVLNDRVVTIDISLIVRTDLFGSLQYKDVIDVDGAAYSVEHEPIRIADGKYCVLALEAQAAESVTVVLDGDWL